MTTETTPVRFDDPTNAALRSASRGGHALLALVCYISAVAMGAGWGYFLKIMLSLGSR